MKASTVTVAGVLCCCLSTGLQAETWYLPDGSTMTTQAGSTPPVSGARRVPYPGTKQAQGGPQVVIPSAPSIAQLQGLLPKLPAPSSQPTAIGDPIKTSPRFADAKVGQSGGQCAAFAQYARPELMGFGNANQMPDSARRNGFEVDGVPRVGSVLVVAKPKGSTYGHAAVVTSAQKEGERYVLTVKDSNANEDELVSVRTVYYTPSQDGTFGNYGAYEEATPGLTKLAKDLVVMGFIQDKPTSTTK